MNTKFLILSVLVAAVLIGGGVFLKNKDVAKSDSSSELASAIYRLESGDINKKYNFTVALGDPGSEHTHISVMFFIKGNQVNFAEQKYMLQDSRMHFENNDGVTIHKHATGVNLPVFFASLDIRINQDCFMLDITKEYCGDGENKLTFIVNGQESEDVYRELQDGDKILINYGSDSQDNLQKKFNAIPDPKPSSR